MLGLESYIESEQLELVASDVLFYEVNQIPDITRKEYALEFLQLSSKIIPISAGIEKKAEAYEAVGIKSIDSLHIAFADAGEVDYFCTTDDKFLKKLKNCKVNLSLHYS